MKILCEKITTGTHVINVRRDSIAIGLVIEDALRCAQMVDNDKFPVTDETYIPNGFKFRTLIGGKWCRVTEEKDGTFSADIYQQIVDFDGKVVGEKPLVGQAGTSLQSAAGFLYGFFKKDILR